MRGSISIYDIDRGHRLVKTISTVPNVDDVRGVAVSAVTGKLYVSYRTHSGVGMIYCLSVYQDVVLWNRAIKPDVDRLSIHPNGRLLYVPTWEGGSADYINVLDADSGDVVREVNFSNRSHDTQFPLSGPLFQETKATDGSGNYLYMIDPSSYAVSRIGHVSASIPRHPLKEPGMLHGIGWIPDESEVWENSSDSDPHVYVWDMLDPMVPKLKEQLSLRGRHGGHWLTFDLKGAYAYIAPEKNSEDGTEVFDAQTHRAVGSIGSSEDIVEIDFTDGMITGTSDQYAIGRAAR